MSRDRSMDLWCVIEYEMDDPWEAPELKAVHGPVVSERLARELKERLNRPDIKRYGEVVKMTRLIP